MKIYRGNKMGGIASVTVGNTNFEAIPAYTPDPLDPRNDLYNHSPDGFEWGYAGSGPSQLSLAILADYLGNDQTAMMLYQQFKFKVIANISTDTWELNEEEVRRHIVEILTQINKN